MKDLSIIKNRNLDEIVIVDNSTSSFIKQIHNGVPIIPFFCKKDDIELIKLSNFLLNLHNAWESGFSIPKMLRSYFAFDRYIGTESDVEVYQKIFNFS